MPLTCLIIVSLLLLHTKGECVVDPATHYHATPAADCGSATRPKCMKICEETAGCTWSGDPDYPRMGPTDVVQTYAQDQMNRLIAHNQQQAELRRERGVARSALKGISRTIQESIFTTVASRNYYDEWRDVFDQAIQVANTQGFTNQQGNRITLIKDLPSEVYECFGIQGQTKNFFGNVESYRIKKEAGEVTKPAGAISRSATAVGIAGLNAGTFVGSAIKAKAEKRATKKAAEEAERERQAALAAAGPLGIHTAHREYDDIYDIYDIYTALDYEIYEELVRKYRRDKVITKRILNNEMKSILRVKRRLPH